MMTVEQARELVKECGNATAAAAKAGVPRTTFYDWLQRGQGAAREPLPARVAGASGGFVLQGRRVLAAKPTDVWKGRFHALRQGMGYPLDHLSEQWGIGVETIRGKARRMGALRYVEDAEQPGQYLECAVHPDTPKGK